MRALWLSHLEKGKMEGCKDKIAGVCISLDSTHATITLAGFNPDEYDTLQLTAKKWYMYETW